MLSGHDEVNFQAKCNHYNLIMCFSAYYELESKGDT